ncbi:phosphorylase superfamily protein [Paraphaeosphaeria sporulosa]
MDSSIASEFSTPPQHGRLSRRETTATIASRDWQEQNILSLDGGGIRGYWTLLVLEKLMEYIGERERLEEEQGSTADLHSFLPNPEPANVTQCNIDPNTSVRYTAAVKFLPCHYFDFICGSSTGSLIAIMLSRFRMTVKDCLCEYENMSNQIFGRPRLLSQRNALIPGWTKYSASRMEKAFKKVTTRRCNQADRNELDSERGNEPGFKTIKGTCSITKGGSGSERSLYLLRSYDHQNTSDKTLEETYPILNFDLAESMSIWQVARAATAAPFYFKELVFRPNGENSRVSYSDGGFGQTNNPTEVAIEEINLLHREGNLGVILSIGTAKADNKRGGSGARAHIEQAFETATNPKVVHHNVAKRRYPHYWRLNDESGLYISLDDWRPSYFTRQPGYRTISVIRERFSEWMQRADVVRMLDTCAAELVSRRRKRAQHEHLWERFATGISQFQCRNRECSQNDDYFAHRGTFDKHWENEHSQSEDAEKLREPMVTLWEYQARP